MKSTGNRTKKTNTQQQRNVSSDNPNLLNAIQDPGQDSQVNSNRKNGPDFARGRSMSKQAVNQTNLESIHSSQSMLVMEH